MGKQLMLFAYVGTYCESLPIIPNPARFYLMRFFRSGLSIGRSGMRLSISILSRGKLLIGISSSDIPSITKFSRGKTGTILLNCNSGKACFISGILGVSIGRSLRSIDCQGMVPSGTTCHALREASRSALDEESNQAKSMHGCMSSFFWSFMQCFKSLTKLA